MSISFAAALAGTVLAAVGTGLAIRLCVRNPRTDMGAWVIALAGLNVALAAQAAGYRRGFVPATFRATQLGAALIAPLALAWGIAEVAAKGLVARFAARLCLAGLFVVAGVILATDVLSSQPFSQKWPAARDHFEFLPRGLLDLVAVAVAATVLLALATTGLRSRRDPAWRAALIAVVLASLAVLATQGLQVALPANTAYPALTLIAAVAAWLAAGRAARVSVGRIRGGADGPGRPPAPGDDPGYRGEDSLDLYRDGYLHFDDSGAFAAYANSGYGKGGGSQGATYGTPAGQYGGGYGEGQYADTGGFTAGGNPGTGSFPPAGDAGFHANPVEPVTGAFDPLFRPHGSAASVREPAAGAGAGASSLGGGPALTLGEHIEFATGMQLPAIDAAVAGPGTVDTDQLYGRIAIYTLLDSGADEFDRLAEQVVDEVRTGEPDTLAYVVHGVPSAPLQRILYQLYADRSAYDRHQERPYVADFESRRRPLVLATNVIELGVRQAKVAAVTPRRVP
ncbi:MAG: putative quinol monooxygenase [Streptosporangiaceae bacterium]